LKPDIPYILKDLISTKNLQQWINNRFKDDSKIIIEKDYFKGLITKDDLVFNMSNNILTIEEVYKYYQFDDIRRDNIVIDIGANIGAFSILASKFSDHVYAIEPITVEELRANILLNNAKVNVIERALGNGDIITVQWGMVKKDMETMTLSQIIDLCGGCDFLKCDCEGGEWYIRKEEIKGIRAIEMEYHCFGSHRVEDLLKMLSDYTIKVSRLKAPIRGPKDLGIIHARRIEK